MCLDTNGRTDGHTDVQCSMLFALTVKVDAWMLLPLQDLQQPFALLAPQLFLLRQQPSYFMSVCIVVRVSSYHSSTALRLPVYLSPSLPFPSQFSASSPT